MLLELTTVDGLPTFLSPFSIESVTQTVGHSIVTMHSGDTILVQEDAAEVHIELTNLIVALQGGVDTGSMH